MPAKEGKQGQIAMPYHDHDENGRPYAMHPQAYARRRLYREHNPYADAFMLAFAGCAVGLVCWHLLVHGACEWPCESEWLPEPFATVCDYLAVSLVPLYSSAHRLDVCPLPAEQQLAGGIVPLNGRAAPPFSSLSALLCCSMSPSCLLQTSITRPTWRGSRPPRPLKGLWSICTSTPPCRGASSAS